MTGLPVEQAFLRALVSPELPVPTGLVSPRGTNDAARFAVYRNNVHVSLVEALRARFPVCTQLVGHDFFTGMARAYVADHKPRTPVLLDYGQDFPDFVSAFPAARPVPYLADVARLEVAWSDAYNAAEAAMLTIESLGAIAPERLPECRIELHPATRFVASSFPVGSIWSAHQSDQPAEIGHRGSETVLLTRPMAHVSVTRIAAADGVFLAGLAIGKPLGQATEEAMAADAAFAPGTALVGLTGLGAFAAIDGGIA